MSRTVALLVAAGSGLRLGTRTPKAFVEVAGAALLVHAARPLLDSGVVDDLVVVAVDDGCAQAASLLDEAGLPARAVVAGGQERHDSVARGLEALDDADAVVAVHDAARPLVSPALVRRTVAALTQGWSAVAPAMPVVDTLKLAGEDGHVVRTVDRTGLWAVQTPQVFPLTALRQAHAGGDLSGATDDLALVERAGGRARLVEGERQNFKITYPEDLELAAAVLCARERR